MRTDDGHTPRIPGHTPRMEGHPASYMLLFQISTPNRSNRLILREHPLFHSRKAFPDLLFALVNRERVASEIVIPLPLPQSDEGFAAAHGIEIRVAIARSRDDLVVLVAVLVAVLVTENSGRNCFQNWR